MSKIYFRLDDIAPNMNWENFNRLILIYNKHDIKPLLAVIPNNQDTELLKHPLNHEFLIIIDGLKRNGWIIAQHGYRHVYGNQNGGILNINSKSEFAGLNFETQRQMTENGKKILEEKFGDINTFVAPGHSFDKNTVKALKENGFNYISDGVALYPFKKRGLIWLPQILWRPRKVWLGFITVAFHPNTMTDEDFNNLEEFIEKNPEKIGNFSELMNWYSRAGVLKKFFAFFVNLIFKPIWQMAFKLKYGLSR
ncbi:MAG: DUF2334 domain-containing protein [Candidatus Azambacteria bacterium]|nr:DUF2334 domain-containing protein [Candidatus Azambacteria bacterium]